MPAGDHVQWAAPLAGVGACRMPGAAESEQDQHTQVGEGRGGERAISVTNPYTGEPIGSVPKATLEEVRDPANQLAQTRTRVYSNLNRLAQEIGAQSQTTTYGYDNQGNVTSIDGPLEASTRCSTSSACAEWSRYTTVSVCTVAVPPLSTGSNVPERTSAMRGVVVQPASTRTVCARRDWWSVARPQRLRQQPSRRRCRLPQPMREKRSGFRLASTRDRSSGLALQMDSAS